MKLVYLGTPEAAVAPLRALVSAGHEVLLVVSNPDRRRGRGAQLVASPVKAAALELDLPVTDEVDDIHAAVAKGAELGVVVAYGRLIRKPLLSVLPFVNLHFSLLPRWRGAAPMERALLAGDSETGVCLMALEEGLDTGGVYRRVTTPIIATETGASLRSRLVGIGTELLLAALDGASSVADLGAAEPQTGEVTWAAKIDSAERELDFSQPADTLNRWIRLGGAFSTLRGKRLKILAAQVLHPDGESEVEHGQRELPGSLDALDVVCGRGRLRLQKVQPEGKAAMDALSWRNGIQIQHGEVLGRSASAISAEGHQRL